MFADLFDYAALGLLLAWPLSRLLHAVRQRGSWWPERREYLQAYRAPSERAD